MNQNRRNDRRHFLLICLLLLTAALPLSGCSSLQTVSAGVTDNGIQTQEETLEYNGIIKKKSELSQDTIEWLDWYQSLPQEQQDALSFVPSEFTDSQTAQTEGTDTGTGAAEVHLPSASPVIEAETKKSSGSYYYLLTDQELEETEELARYYFTELAPAYGGVVGLRPAEDSSPLYHNKGIEDEYTPGNIIIYYVLTGSDEAAGNPMRSISIARRSKSDDWKVINSGY